MLRSPARTSPIASPLVHLSEELVDALLTVAVVATLNVVLELASAPAASGVRELEGPEEVACSLEIQTSGMDLVDEILDGDDAVLAECSFNDGVRRGGHTACQPLRSRACRLAHEQT